MLIGQKEISFVVENKQKVLDTLCHFVLTDTILFCENCSCFKEVKQELEAKLTCVNKLLGTAYVMTDGLTIQSENYSQREKILNYFFECSDIKLTVLYMVALKLRSVLLGVLFVEEKVSAKECFDLALYEELKQQKQWGCDEEQKLVQQKLSEELGELERLVHERSLSKN